MAEPLMTRNKCLRHNLLKRSLGLPHKFTLQEDKFVPPPQSKSCTLYLSYIEEPVTIYGVPCAWNLLFMYHNGFHPTSKEALLAAKPTESGLAFCTRMNTSKKEALDTTKEYTVKKLMVHKHATQISSLCPRSIYEKPSYQPSLQKLVKNRVWKPKDLHCKHKIDKVFCAEWINDDEVVLGTKCHNLLCYNTKLDIFAKIMGPSLCNVAVNSPGIRCIKRNPSSSLLATVDPSGSRVALFVLPSMAPLTVLAENLDTGWIFDVCWLSDSKLAIAEREGKVSIWNIESLFLPPSSRDSSIPQCMSRNKYSSQCLRESPKVEGGIKFDESLLDIAPKGYCQMSLYVPDRVRALAFNGDQTLFVLNSGGFLSSFNTSTYRSNWIMPIPGGVDNTCLAYSQTLRLLAIGSVTGVLFVEDCGGYPYLSMVELPTADSLYIRSLSIVGHTLSVGTGAGQLYFIDLSQFWAGRLVYYRTRYTFPINKHDGRHRLEGYVDPRRNFLNYGRSLNNAVSIEHGISLKFSKIQTFDRPLHKTFFEITKHLGLKNELHLLHQVDQYYCKLDTQLEEEDDSNSHYTEQFYRRPLTNFEKKTLVSAPEDRGALLQENTPAVYAQTYNPHTGQLFVAGGPITVRHEGSFCALLR